MRALKLRLGFTFHCVFLQKHRKKSTSDPESKPAPTPDSPATIQREPESYQGGDPPHNEPHPDPISFEEQEPKSDLVKPVSSRSRLLVPAVFETIPEEDETALDDSLIAGSGGVGGGGERKDEGEGEVVAAVEGEGGTEEEEVEREGVREGEGEGEREVITVETTERKEEEDEGGKETANEKGKYLEAETKTEDSSIADT